MSQPIFSSIESAIDDLRQGRMIILTDSEGRENEGDLVIAAEHATPQAINFMSKAARGLICLSMTEEAFDRLRIPMMASRNRSMLQAAFGVSFEAAKGVSTGISAFDRAETIRVAINPASGPNDITMPGHTFPLKAQKGGILTRQGHTEGSVDLARLAGCEPAAVISEIMNPDGSMARLPDLISFANQHQLSIVNVADLIRYRLAHENILNLATRISLPTKWGEFYLQSFHNSLFAEESFALIKEPLDTQKPCLVRLHSQCLTGDIFGSKRCDCGQQLSMSMTRIAEEGGVLLYLHQEGRGIGLLNKIKAYALQEKGLDTVEANQHLGFAADERDYVWAAQMLKSLRISHIKLLTNNPHKVKNLESYHINVTERIPLEVKPDHVNLVYLHAKREKLGHIFSCL